MSWTLCTSGAAIAKAGANANSTITASGAALAEWSSQVEGTINARTRKDWVADYGSVTANFKPILADTASDMIAIKIINYDPGGYIKPRLILDVLTDNSNKNLKVLEDDKNKEKML